MTNAHQATATAEPPYGADVIAEHLIDIYDIVPFMLPNGEMGLHFMNLSTSIGRYYTCQTQGGRQAHE